MTYTKLLEVIYIRWRCEILNNAYKLLLLFEWVGSLPWKQIQEVHLIKADQRKGWRNVTAAYTGTYVGRSLQQEKNNIACG